MPTIPVTVDVSQGRHALNTLNNQVSTIKQKFDNVKRDMWIWFQQGMQVTNMLLRTMKESAAQQVALATTQALSVGITIAQTSLQSKAAFLEGRIASGFLLAGITATLVGTQFLAYQAKADAEANKFRMDRIQEYRKLHS